MNKRLIGLSGPKGVGKSTVARALAGATNGEVMSLAQPIREGLAAMGLSVTDYDLLKEVDLIHGKSLRDLMKSLGTEWGRDLVHEDIWVTLLLERYDRTDAKVVIVDDVRMVNEARAIHDEGGAVFEIARPGIGYDGDHLTETPIESTEIDMAVDASDVTAAVDLILGELSF
jgi:nucleoside-triphosphatase THEP1